MQYEEESIESLKKELRKMIRSYKAALTEQDIRTRSRSIWNNLRLMKEFQMENEYYFYMNYNQEVDTKSMIIELLKDDSRIFLPRVDGEDMDFYEIHSLDDCESGSYGILEPKSSCIKVDNPKGIMIMPGLAFDKEGHRIGYGGGFYDRYLEKYPDFTKIACCYNFQLVDYVPTSEHDILIDYIVTEDSVYRKEFHGNTGSKK